MFLNSTVSLQSKCETVIQLAKTGEIDVALDLLASIRWQRTLLNETTARLSDPSVYAFFSDEDINGAQALVVSAPRLEELFHEIDTWISDSFESFEEQNLMTSNVGVNLCLEHLLPNAWLYGGDIAVLSGLHVMELHQALCARGQHKFIVLLSEQDSYSDFAQAFASENSGLVLLASDESPPTLADMKALAGSSWPKMAFLVNDPSSAETALFEQCHELLRAACIQTNTRRWLPQLTCEQYLSNLAFLASRPSVNSFKKEFKDTDVLVVSPGPSLLEDLPLLRTNQSKFTIIAALKAVDTLLNNRIKPDFAIWQDPRDHSNFLPSHPDFKDIPLIINECCHRKFLEASKQNCVISNDPHLVNLPTTAALHGSDIIETSAASVSTMACILALNFGCKSITLLGQDLNVSSGAYVSDVTSGIDIDAPEGPISEVGKTLFCEGIDGARLRTLPNYLSFIAEFEQIAVAYSLVPLFNCTSRGAFLKGWSHLTLRDRVTEVSEYHSSTAANLDLSESESRKRQYLTATSCQLLKTSLERWLVESQAMTKNLTSELSPTHEHIDLQRQELVLKQLLQGDCSILVYYCAGVSQLVTDAVKSCSETSEIDLLSLDYYQSIDRAARKLISLCESANRNLERGGDV